MGGERGKDEGGGAGGGGGGGVAAAAPPYAAAGAAAAAAAGWELDPAVWSNDGRKTRVLDIRCDWDGSVVVLLARFC